MLSPYFISAYSPAVQTLNESPMTRQTIKLVSSTTNNFYRPQLSPHPDNVEDIDGSENLEDDEAETSPDLIEGDIAIPEVNNSGENHLTSISP